MASVCSMESLPTWFPLNIIFTNGVPAVHLNSLKQTAFTAQYYVNYQLSCMHDGPCLLCVFVDAVQLSFCTIGTCIYVLCVHCVQLYMSDERMKQPNSAHSAQLVHTPTSICTKCLQPHQCMYAILAGKPTQRALGGFLAIWHWNTMHHHCTWNTTTMHHTQCKFQYI